MLIRALTEAQAAEGYLSPDTLALVALRVGVPLYQVQEVASFFPAFRFQRRTKDVLHVCQSMVCHLKWSRADRENIREWIETRAREPRETDRVEVRGASCLGRCDRGPVALLEADKHEEVYCELNNPALEQLITRAGAGHPPAPVHDLEAAEGASVRNIHPNDWSLVTSYRDAPVAPPTYKALRGYCDTDERRDSILKRIEDAKLVGMGGAAAQTVKKWRMVRESKDPTRYVVCNADESEPGTFKDRELLVRFPERVIEGVLLASLVLKAHRAFIYVRHEYHEQIAKLEDELAAIRRGERTPEIQNILADHPVEVFRSPGRYICGEETALLEVIEGRRAQPRNNPFDWIRDQGLFGHPTAVNNVETFAWVPTIALLADAPPPRRFFSVSGDVNSPGVFEMSGEDTLGTLLARAGGVLNGGHLLAVAPSGPSGGFLPAQFDGAQFGELVARAETAIQAARAARRPRHEIEAVEKFIRRERSKPFSVLDLPLDVQIFRAVGLSLGAGIVFYARGAKGGDGMKTHANNCLQFFRDESCGKCVPCRLGTEQLVQLGTKTTPWTTDDATFARLLPATMNATSICGLGRTASRPLDTYLAYFSGTAAAGAPGES